MVKNGKKVSYIDSNNFVDFTEESNMVYNSVISQMPDKVRYFSKNYWTQKDKKLTKVDKKNNVFDIEMLNKNTIILKAKKDKFFLDYFENGILSKKFSPSEWENFLLATIPDQNQIFEDFYTLFPEPINLSETKTGIESNVSYIKKEFFYNFFAEEYENLVNSQNFDVKTIPTVFSLYNDTKTDVRTEEENLRLSLGGFINQNLVDSLQLANSINNNVKSYFKEFSKIYNNPDVLPVLSKIKLEQNQIFINKEKNNLTKTSKTTFVPFPFYFYSEFTNLSQDKNDFIHVLNDLGVDQTLLNFIYQTQIDDEKNFVYASDDLQQTSLKIYDLKKFIDNQINTFLIPSDNLQQASNLTSMTELMNYISKNLKAKTRNYEEMLDNSCHNEVLFFKIEKRQFNFESSPIQTFWITPDNNSIIKFFDTQIKYGTEYFYTIQAYTVIVGTAYKYEPYLYTDQLERTKDLNNGFFKLKVTCNSTYKIVEIPFAKIKNAVYEPPLTKPIVKFELLEDKVVFSFEQPETESLEEFNVIENNDLKIFESIKLSQDNEEKNKIRSVNVSSLNSKIQIYRLTNVPRNYIDFQGKIYKNIILQKNSKSFIDNLTKNVKFYYMFRVLNNHNVPSNTSDIYEVQFYDEEGTYELRTKKIDINATMPKKLSKLMKKYILIRPSIIQTRYTGEETINNLNNFSLGPDKEKIWNKDFVLRIKSLKTNRVLEFNLSSIINKKK